MILPALCPTDAQLSSTFSLGTRGNSIAAILAGVLATFLADRFGYVSPFMASLVCLVAAGVYVAATWSENYGDQKCGCLYMCVCVFVCVCGWEI